MKGRCGGSGEALLICGKVLSLGVGKRVAQGGDGGSVGPAASETSATSTNRCVAKHKYPSGFSGGEFC